VSVSGLGRRPLRHRRGLRSRRRLDGLLTSGHASPTLVAAAVIHRGGKILITRRPAGKPLAGLWEFPGGKVAPGESPSDALRREIREELGASATIGEALDTVDWQYPDRHVRLLFFRCAIEGEPRALEGQEVAWVSPAELSRYEFPPADARLIERLRLD